MFASTLSRLARVSVIEGQKICNGGPPKAGIGGIYNWTPFLVEMDGETFL
jgi:hypothetical protein